MPLQAAKTRPLDLTSTQMLIRSEEIRKSSIAIARRTPGYYWLRHGDQQTGKAPRNIGFVIFTVSYTDCVFLYVHYRHRRVCRASVAFLS